MVSDTVPSRTLGGSTILMRCPSGKLLTHRVTLPPMSLPPR